MRTLLTLKSASMMVKPFKEIMSKGKMEKPEACSGTCTSMADQSEKATSSTNKKHKFKIKILNKIKLKPFLKSHKVVDGIPGSHPVSEIPLDFKQNLQQLRLAEADRLLLDQEVELFIAELPDDPVSFSESEEDMLQVNYENLLLQLRIAFEDSFNKENHETLKSALATVLQEEQRDKHWLELEEQQRPRWRPLRCRQIHDTLLEKVVEVRLQQAREETNAHNLSTPLKTEVCRMGRQIQKDLLLVVKELQGCYSPEFDVCNKYAQLYHQAFSTRLMELVRSKIDIEECIYILSWINTYYPKDVLQQQELEAHINTESLGPLLAEEDVGPLEEQYLSQKEAELRVWLSNALEKEEESWQNDQTPELIDGYFFSNLALDVINLVDGVMNISIITLGNEDKCQSILCQLDSFLVSYKKCIADLFKGKHKNISDIVKANLVSILQLMEYIEDRQNLEDNMKAALLSSATDLRDSCQKCLLSPMHGELKEQYRKLWTLAWMSERENVTRDLVNTLKGMLQCFTNMKPSCREDLISQLHFKVMTEYVRRMLKRKLKLKSKVEQETAAGFICADSNMINSFFIDNGSREKWLSSVLVKLSEVVRLQDMGALQLEITTLARAYPDISDRHILALLQLKTNLSRSNVHSIKNSVTENKDALTSEPMTQFFSKDCTLQNLREQTVMRSEPFLHQSYTPETLTKKEKELEQLQP